MVDRRLPARWRDAARDAASPRAGTRERLHAQLTRAIAAGNTTGTSERVAAALAGRPRMAPASLKLLLPTLLVGIGIGAVFSSSWERRFTGPPATPPPNQVLVESQSSAAAPSAVEPARPSLMPAPTPEAKPARRPTLPARSHRPTTHERAVTTMPASADTAPPNEPSPTDQLPEHHLAEELKLMRAASTGLNTGDLASAGRSLSEHARRFPNGTLSQERQGLQLIVQCKLGRNAASGAERQAFLAAHGHSPVSTRVRAACEAP